MTDIRLILDRRALLGGLGAVLVLPITPTGAQARTALALDAVAGMIVLKPGQPPTPIWQLAGGADTGPLRFKKGETVDVTLRNRLPLPVALNWLGLDGNPAAEPITGGPMIAPNASATVPVTFRHAGTLLVDLLTPDTAQTRPSTPRPIIIPEPEPLTIDRDEVLLFQDWRLTMDGNAVPPGSAPGDSAAIFTVNGKASYDLTASQNQRLRFRLINSCQRTVIAIKTTDYDVRVLAIDGQPSEPFLARNGVVVLTPGSRVDAVIDATNAAGSTSSITLLDGREARPFGKLMMSDAKPVRSPPLPIPSSLPSNSLPAQLDLKSASRIDLPLGTADWFATAALSATTPPAFKVKRGRIVVLALTNRGVTPVAFHLHGHHFRLLDRLDDGWKPFWLDTLAVNAGQTQRIAFAAEFPGLYPMQSTATDWAAPRLVRSYLVE